MSEKETRIRKCKKEQTELYAEIVPMIDELPSEAVQDVVDFVDEKLKLSGNGAKNGKK